LAIAAERIASVTSVSDVEWMGYRRAVQVRVQKSKKKKLMHATGGVAFRQ